MELIAWSIRKGQVQRQVKKKVNIPVKKQVNMQFQDRKLYLKVLFQK